MNTTLRTSIAAEQVAARGDRTSDAPGEWIVDIEGLRHRLWDPERREEFVVEVERRITIPAGCFVSLLGQSGCGKTTLLTVLGLLRKVTDLADLTRFTMRVWEDGRFVEYDLKDLWLKGRDREIEHLRRRHIGFALQSGELLPALTVRENIAAPLLLNENPADRCRARVDQLIRAFGLDRSRDGKADGPAADGRRGYDSALARSRVNRLSGGEYQRVALARSIAHWPAIVFVDEPTASLNRDRAREALEQLKALRTDGDRRSTVVMITHDEGLAYEFSDMIIRMAPVPLRVAGHVEAVILNTPTPKPSGPLPAEADGEPAAGDVVSPAMQ